VDPTASRPCPNSTVKFENFWYSCESIPTIVSLSVVLATFDWINAFKLLVLPSSIKVNAPIALSPSGKSFVLSQLPVLE